LERFFIINAHKELQEKRTQEECDEMMREWGLARSRMEGEIQRKKEHINEATQF
jgi:hypothetical protein